MILNADVDVYTKILSNWKNTPKI